MEAKYQCICHSLQFFQYASYGKARCSVFASTKQLEWFNFFNKYVLWTAEVLIDPQAKYQRSMCSRVDHGGKISMYIPSFKFNKYASYSRACCSVFVSTKQLEWFNFFNKHVLQTAEVLIYPLAKNQMFMCSRVDHAGKILMHMPESLVF